MKIKYRLFKETPILRAVQVLAQQKIGNLRVARDVGRLHRCLQREMEDMQGLYSKTITEYFAKDEKGEYIPAEGGSPGQMQIIEGKLQEFIAKVQEFCEMEIDIDAEPINLDMLGNDVKLSGDEVMALEPVLTESAQSEQHLP